MIDQAWIQEALKSPSKTQSSELAGGARRWLNGLSRSQSTLIPSAEPHLRSWILGQSAPNKQRTVAEEGLTKPPNHPTRHAGRQTNKQKKQANNMQKPHLNHSCRFVAVAVVAVVALLLSLSSWSWCWWCWWILQGASDPKPRAVLMVVNPCRWKPPTHQPKHGQGKPRHVYIYIHFCKYLECLTHTHTHTHMVGRCWPQVLSMSPICAQSKVHQK